MTDNFQRMFSSLVVEYFTVLVSKEADGNLSLSKGYRLVLKNNGLLENVF